jgi:hypothetical protein
MIIWRSWYHFQSVASTAMSSEVTSCTMQLKPCYKEVVRAGGVITLHLKREASEREYWKPTQDAQPSKQVLSNPRAGLSPHLGPHPPS